MSEDFIFPNTFKSMKEFSYTFSEEGTKPEFECYDSGMINNLAFMIQRGYPIRKPVYIQFVMGVLGGITASPENLLFLVRLSLLVYPKIHTSSPLSKVQMHQLLARPLI